LIVEGSLQLERLNYAQVVLIPKKGKANKVGNFRPISVLIEKVKIISKVLANRLREILREMIKDHQSGFIKGRSTLDSITMAYEVIQFTKRNKIKGFMLKPDFEKAYDTVDWECVIENLQSSGFNLTWISWIKLWLFSAKVSILINGLQGWKISCKRDLR